METFMMMSPHFLYLSWWRENEQGTYVKWTHIWAAS